MQLYRRGRFYGTPGIVRAETMKPPKRISILSVFAAAYCPSRLLWWPLATQQLSVCVWTLPTVASYRESTGVGF